MSAVQRGAIDGVALATSLVLAPLDAWDRLANVFQSRSSLQEEVLRLVLLAQVVLRLWRLWNLIDP